MTEVMLSDYFGAKNWTKDMIINSFNQIKTKKDREQNPEEPHK